MFVYQTFYVNRPNTINNDIIIPESEIIIFTGNYKKKYSRNPTPNHINLKTLLSPFFGRPGQVLGGFGDGIWSLEFILRRSKILFSKDER